MRSFLARLRETLEPVGIAPAEAVALVILLAGSVALTTVVWWTNQPPSPSADGPAVVASGTPAIDGEPSPDESPAGDAVVHVAGAVGTPGLVTLPPGARVADAIDAAGGLAGDAATDALNLARPVVDGEQIVVPVQGQEPPAPDPQANPTTTDDAPVDLNQATTEQLQALPGIGPVMAERIIAHRETLGGFVDVTQLLEVPGIGPGRFAELEPLVST